MEELEKMKVSEREKELAADASTAYNSGDYDSCLIALEKLEVKCEIETRKLNIKMLFPI